VISHVWVDAVVGVGGVVPADHDHNVTGNYTLQSKVRPMASVRDGRTPVTNGTRGESIGNRVR
jgi:hypothetical protein